MQGRYNINTPHQANTGGCDVPGSTPCHHQAPSPSTPKPGSRPQMVHLESQLPGERALGLALPLSSPHDPGLVSVPLHDSKQRTPGASHPSTLHNPTYTRPSWDSYHGQKDENLELCLKYLVNVVLTIFWSTHTMQTINCASSGAFD